MKKERDYDMLLNIYNDLYVWINYFEYNNQDRTAELLERIEYDLLYENTQPIKKKLEEFIKIAQEATMLYKTLYPIQIQQLKEILEDILHTLQEDKKMDEATKKQLIQ